MAIDAMLAYTAVVDRDRALIHSNVECMIGI
jgi:hypothetical protein